MTFYSGPREGAHVLHEARGLRSREQGVAAPSAIAAMRPGLLVQSADGSFSGLTKWDGTGKLKGVVYGFANQFGEVALDARDAELKGDRLVFRTSAPTVFTGDNAAVNVSPAGNLSVNGTVVAIADGATPAAVAAAVSAQVAGVTASVVDLKLRFVLASGGDLTVAGDAGVLADLGLTAGTVHGKSAAVVKAEDLAALASLGLVVR